MSAARSAIAHVTHAAGYDRPVMESEPDPDVERDFGPQPIGALMERHGLRAHDLVAASTSQLTHKMVARAVKGRRLTPNALGKVLAALNTASGGAYTAEDAFTYTKRVE